MLQSQRNALEIKLQKWLNSDLPQVIPFLNAISITGTFPACSVAALGAAENGVAMWKDQKVLALGKCSSAAQVWIIPGKWVGFANLCKRPWAKIATDEPYEIQYGI